MNHLVVLVLDNLNKYTAVLDGWELAGAPAITILESNGLRSLRASADQSDYLVLPSIASLIQGREHHHRTIFTVTDQDEIVDQIIETTQNIIGDLSEPGNGILFVIPVSRVVGLRKW